MDFTKIYIACDSTNALHLKRAAELIATQKGCDPDHIGWNHQANTKQLQWRQEESTKRIRSCDLFVAIVDDQYGDLRIDSPHSRNRVSALHAEILEVCNIRERQPDIWVYALNTRRDPAGQSLLENVKSHVIKYDTDQHFRKRFSERLAEYQQAALTAHLAGLHRVKVSVTCSDQSGLLAEAAQVIHDHQGNLASGNQTTSGPLAILHFVAEWSHDRLPTNRVIKQALERALPASDDTQIMLSRIGPGEPEVRTKITFLITFIDHPGVADLVFSHLKDQNTSVFSTLIETFISGGTMLGRIHFTLNGDSFPREGQSLLEEKLRKLPGIISVDSSALRGRYWT